MRIAVVSDIHGNLPALLAVVADFTRRGGIDQVINLGDSLSGPLLPRETAEYLMAQPDWVHLAGNHERQVLTLNAHSNPSDTYAHAQLSAAELSWIASLPHSRPWGEDVWLCHGTPDSDITYFLQTLDRAATASEVAARLGTVTTPLVLCGHTHVPRSVRSGSSLILNPGSVGHPAFASNYPVAHAVESGSPDARYAIAERRNGVWSASLISVPYPHHTMVQLAQLHNRPDWECALRTGYMA